MGRLAAAAADPWCARRGGADGWIWGLETVAETAALAGRLVGASAGVLEEESAGGAPLEREVWAWAGRVSEESGPCFVCAAGRIPRESHGVLAQCAPQVFHGPIQDGLNRCPAPLVGAYWAAIM